MAAHASSDRSDVLASLLGAHAPGIAQAFRRMGIAEEEIAAAKARWPRRRKALHAAFGILCAPRLARYSDAMYRAHAHELLGRVMRGEPLEPGTDAEVLAMLSEGSLVAPLAPDYAHAMSAVFHRVFPEADPEKLAAGSEPWHGRTDEIIDDARRRLALKRTNA